MASVALVSTDKQGLMPVYLLFVVSARGVLLPVADAVDCCRGEKSRIYLVGRWLQRGANDIPSFLAVCAWLFCLASAVVASLLGGPLCTVFFPLLLLPISLLHRVSSVPFFPSSHFPASFFGLPFVF